MTVSTTNNTKTYTGDNSTTAFSFPYLFYDNSHLVVKVDGTTQTINTHYTVSGAGVGAGGTVTFITAPATSAAIVIQRIVPHTQETDLENFDGNPSDVTEKQFDLDAMGRQQIAEQNARTILVPVGTALTSNEVSGTINTSTKVLTLTTAGPAVSSISNLSTEIDAIVTTPASGEILEYDGTNWVNVTKAAAGLATLTGTETLTNKRLTARVGTVASGATITPTGDDSDLYTVTALATNATIAAPSGTPTNGQALIIRIKDNGTSRTLSWNAIYRAFSTALPTATTISKTLYVACIYNSADSKWDVTGVSEEA